MRLLLAPTLERIGGRFTSVQMAADSWVEVEETLTQDIAWRRHRLCHRRLMSL